MRSRPAGTEVGAIAVEITSLIRTIPDHPKPGIQFRDVTTLLGDAQGLRAAMEDLAERYRDHGIEAVAGIEARGFIFGSVVAYLLGTGFVPIRKQGKLPGPTMSREYDLEYGQDRIEIHEGAVTPGQRILLVDDLIATGGTAEAGVSLLREAGGLVEQCAFLVALPDLGGIRRLESLDCKVQWACEFEGD